MNKTVLVVDDDKRIANLISIRLKKEGYSPVSVFDGRGALEWIERQPAGLVMLDIRLPDMEGVLVLQRIKEINSKTDVIMMTGYPEMETARQSLTLGAYDYIVKPFDLDYMRLAVLTKLLLQPES